MKKNTLISLNTERSDIFESSLEDLQQKAGFGLKIDPERTSKNKLQILGVLNTLIQDMQIFKDAETGKITEGEPIKTENPEQEEDTSEKEYSIGENKQELASYQAQLKELGVTFGRKKKEGYSLADKKDDMRFFERLYQEIENNF
jgi:hypothetical protein